jgi:hypothetical protein
MDLANRCRDLFEGKPCNSPAETHLISVVSESFEFASSFYNKCNFMY